MNRQLQRLYRRVRKAGVACIVGENAAISLNIARTILQFEALESAGLVEITLRDDPDPDLSYVDTWEHMSERSREEYKERTYHMGIYGVIGRYRPDPDHDWHVADSIWGCVGYENAASPFENCYVPDIMAQTITALRTALKDRFCDKCGHRVHAA